jgi:hypothetical protein
LVGQLQRFKTDVNTAVLLIDKDLSFAFWLGKALDQAGYQAFPARNEPDAVELLSQISMDLGMLIVGEVRVSVEALAARWHERHKNLRIVRLIGPDDEPGPPVPGVDAEYQKPSGKKEEELVELLLAIERAFASSGELIARSPA